jgi:glutaredoxin 3
MSFIFRRLFGTTPTFTMEAAQKKAQQLIDDNAVSKFSPTLLRNVAEQRARG